MGPLPDHYAVLGVLPASEEVVIRGAYLALIKKYHPDTFAGSRDYAERKSKEINAAYAVLSDPQGRKAYDELRSTRAQETSRPRSEAQGSPRREEPRRSASTSSRASHSQTFSEKNRSRSATSASPASWKNWWAAGLVGVALFAVVATSYGPSDPQTDDEASATAPDEFSVLSGTENRRFLADNAQRPGVKVRPSGLQYRIISSGSGKSPATGDVVRVKYRGRLIDGTVFDETPPGETVSFPLGALIPGWIEALALMKEGDEWEIVVPPELGYGEEGAGGAIPPDQTLVFDVALMRVQKQ